MRFKWTSARKQHRGLFKRDAQSRVPDVACERDRVKALASRSVPRSCRLYDIGTFRDSNFRQWNTPVLAGVVGNRANKRPFSGLNCHKGRSMPNFGFHIRHGNHSSDHNVDLPDMRAAHEEATMIFGDMARDVAAQLYETPEWRMDVSDESGKSLFRLRLLTEPLE